MMRVSLGFVASVASLMGCAQQPATPARTPAEVLSRIHELNGSTVSVEGWIGPCTAYNCGLYSNKADMDLVERGNTQSKGWYDAMDRRLSVGDGSWWFDWRTNRLQWQRVVITARVSDTCHDPTGTTACFDRADDLQPISIKAAPASEKVD